LRLTDAIELVEKLKSKIQPGLKQIKNQLLMLFGQNQEFLGGNIIFMNMLDALNTCMTAVEMH
jgi:hypothetical protein